MWFAGQGFAGVEMGMKVRRVGGAGNAQDVSESNGDKTVVCSFV